MTKKKCGMYIVWVSDKHGRSRKLYDGESPWTEDVRRKKERRRKKNLCK